MCSSRLSQSELEYVARTMDADNSLTFCGITSAIFSIPTNDDTYAALSADEAVYLVDMSEYIIKSENNDFSLDVIVSDCYYYLEATNEE